MEDKGGKLLTHAQWDPGKSCAEYKMGARGRGGGHFKTPAERQCEGAHPLDAVKRY